MPAYSTQPRYGILPAVRLTTTPFAGVYIQYRKLTIEGEADELVLVVVLYDVDTYPLK
jgi:hypothetical protein